MLFLYFSLDDPTKLLVRLRFWVSQSNAASVPSADFPSKHILIGFAVCLGLYVMALEEYVFGASCILEGKTLSPLHSFNLFYLNLINTATHPT